MRRIVIAAAIAAIPAASLAAPLPARNSIRQVHNDYYYRNYDTSYAPICVVREVRSHDTRGKATIRKVRICR